ncbi:conserved hypothetical protein [Lishizhenia tianjinensis]|uniref:Mucoidy inhibitor MuiA family protein n=1 Tax=Lishizhenia tianjinensis TaxID=477690 RepID=A0A1I6ZPJ7_9FLAO|nr:DUF4139 domain-containing protein [Lishizhenia tianjinensis]SFT64505.1 conserved hypothetical protein [Lishizhenia tianjinensis]
MKYLFLTLLLIAGWQTKANEYPVESKLKSVTVYTQGAQIHRSATYKIATGVHEVIIEGVSPRIDARSLQISGTGNVIILDSKYDVHYPKPDEIEDANALPYAIRKKISALEDSIFNQRYVVAGLTNQMTVVQSSENMIKSNPIMQGKGKVGDSLELLQKSLEYYQKKLMELSSLRLELEQQKMEEQEVLNAMQARLRDLQQYKRNTGQGDPKPKAPIHRVIITLQAKAYTQGTLDISYLVSNAGWQAMYDLRSSANQDKINLNYKAHVYQNTGVDWEDVKLNISTNNPYQNKTKPELREWYLTSYIPNLRKDEVRQKAPQPVQELEEVEIAAYSKTTADAVELKNFEYASTSANYTTVVEQKINVEFQIDLKYTIKSNNEKHMVLIKNEDIEADFAYYTVPKLDESVYLVANITNLDNLKLVPAQANIFFDGSYVGETFINPGVMDDTLSLSLGKDPNLIVERKFLKKKYKEKIIGNEVSKASEYVLRVKNNKAENIKLIIQDQVPITRNENIAIEVNDIGKGKLNERTGLVEWEIKIKSGELVEVPLSYTVYHPKNMQIAVR